MEIPLIFVVYVLGFLLGCVLTWNIVKKSAEKKGLPESVTKAPEPPKKRNWYKITIQMNNGEKIKGYQNLFHHACFNLYEIKDGEQYPLYVVLKSQVYSTGSCVVENIIIDKSRIKNIVRYKIELV